VAAGNRPLVVFLPGASGVAPLITAHLEEEP
jgi:hypothetical protein